MFLLMPPGTHDRSVKPVTSRVRLMVGRLGIYSPEMRVRFPYPALMHYLIDIALVLAVPIASYIALKIGYSTGKSNEVCGCGHHLCYHDDDGCAHEWVENYTRRKCHCIQYIGPGSHKLLNVAQED